MDSARRERMLTAVQENRLRALAHQWLACVDDLSTGSEQLLGFLAPGWHLQFPDQRISDSEQLAAWRTGLAMGLSHSAHLIETFEMQNVADDRYEVRLHCLFLGEDAAGNAIEAQTRHHWLVVMPVSQHQPALIRELEVHFG